MKPIEELAKIKLNLTSVDHFLRVVCSLADDNPEIKLAVYEAAKEVRAASLLIEHLRNLFSHELYTRAAGFPGGQLEQEAALFRASQLQSKSYAREEDRNSKLFTYSTRLTLARASKSLVANVAKILYLTDSVVLSGCEQSLSASGPESAFEREGKFAGFLSDRLDNVANYSQLLRSFGELAGDLVDLGQCLLLSQRAHWGAACHSAAGEEEPPRAQLEPFRLAGAAQVESAPGRQSESYIREEQRMRRLLEQQSVKEELLELGEENFEPYGTLPATLEFRSSESRKLLHQAPSLYEPRAPWASSPPAAESANVILSAGQHQPVEGMERYLPPPSYWPPLQPGRARARTSAKRHPRTPLEEATNRTQDGLEEQETDGSEMGLAGTSGPSWLKEDNRRRLAHDDLLDAQIEDMQILFQVNRLTMDRFILLLLSASKCCLRQGEECLRGFEARRSIVVQIRASISIIMAIVKSAVFGHHQPLSLTSPSGAAGKQQQQQAEELRKYHSASVSSSLAGYSAPEAKNSTMMMMTTNNITITKLPTANTAATPLEESGAGERLIDRTNSTRLSAGRGASLFIKSHTWREPCWRDNQFGGQQQYRREWASLGRQAANEQQQRQQRRQLSLLQNHTAPARLLDKELNLKALDLELENSTPNSELEQRPQDEGRLARKPLQIINYFLRTWSGTESANDAINKLQTLVEPFTRVNNYKSLFQTLNNTFVNYEHSREALLLASGNESLGCKEATEGELLMAGSERAGDLSVKRLLVQQQQRQHNSVPFVQQDPANGSYMLLMNKRQLVNALNVIFLGEVKSNLIERIQEFTDCPYTKHEHRENILLLLQSIRFQLNKLVKLLYKLRRRSSAINELSLGQVRQLASQIEESCAELKCELQTVVVEQSDELDRFYSQLELVKEMKHFCMVGDPVKLEKSSALFLEQAEQLVEVCKMLNQVAPTNKMKMVTRSIGIWFELNVGQLVACARCLGQRPRSKVLKDCTWAYIQVWFSYYDDFCQIARQVAYLSHKQQDQARSARVASARDQILLRRNLDFQPARQLLAEEEDEQQQQQQSLRAPGEFRAEHSAWPLQSAAGELAHFRRPFSLEERPAGSLQSLNLQPQAESFGSIETDSPRSLDHYHGFGHNYRHQLHRNQQEQPAASPECCAGQSSFQQQQRSYLSPFSADLSTSGEFYQASLPPEVSNYNQFGAENCCALDDCFARPQVMVAPEEQGEVMRAPMPPPARRSAPPPSTSQSGDSNVGQASPLPASSSRKGRRSDKKRTPSSVSTLEEEQEEEEVVSTEEFEGTKNQHQQTGADSSSDKWEESSDAADAIVRGAKETAQMALSMYQFTRGEGDLNTTQDLFTQAELFAEEANEIYKEVRCFSYKIPAGELKRELLSQLASIPALVQQLQFVVKNPTVGKPATFAKVDSVIRETRTLMEAVDRVVAATLACRQHYNMAIASMRKRTRTLSPTYRNDKAGFEFNNLSARQSNGFGGRNQAASGAGMGSEPDI